MIRYSIRARMARLGAEAPAWAVQIADLVSKKTGVATQVATRVGGPQEIIWVTSYDDYAAFEAAQAKVLTDPDYLAALQTAADKGLFDTLSVEAAFWQPLSA
jgi:hypothetical protein